MVAVIDSFLASAGPAVQQIVGVIGQFLQLFLLLGVLAYGFMLWRFDIKVHVRELSKGGRTIMSSQRAMSFKEKKTGAPKLRMFGTMGFGGEVISLPPAECLVPTRSRITTKVYDFVKKDGLYYPVKNFVLGVMQPMTVMVDEEKLDEKTGKMEKTGKQIEKVYEEYTIEGSGLEIDRNFDSEQAIQNKLIEEAVQFRNRKPTEIIASYALMIITIIVSGVVMWFAWKQFGNMAGAIASLGPPLKEGILGAAQNIIGPG